MNNLHMRAHLILVLMLWASQTTAQGLLQGTAVAAIRTPNELVVAADSKELNLEGNATSNLVCKIRQVGGVFFTVHGMSGEAATGFDAFRIIDGAVRAKGTLHDIVMRSIEALRGPLESAVNHIRTNNPPEFKRHFINHDALGLIIFGVEEGDVVLCQVGFATSGSGEKPISITVQRHRCPGPDCDSGIVQFLVGPDEATKQEFLRANPVDWKSDLVAMSRSFVQKQIEAHPEDCGPPIDIVRFTKKGPEWIARKMECLLPTEP